MESFENGDSSYSCGRAKTEVFKYDDVMSRFKARSSTHTIRKRYVWMQIFLNTEKKTSVFENTRLRVDEALVQAHRQGGLRRVRSNPLTGRKDPPGSNLFG